MTDIYSQEKRREIMSKISGKETKSEIILRKLLFAKGYRFRKNDKRYPGKPDIVLPKYKTAIFVHGCFWHGHDCPAGKLPETNIEFWSDKIDSTKKRDVRNKNELEKLGWNVITVWECELSNVDKREQKFKEIELLLSG